MKQILIAITLLMGLAAQSQHNFSKLIWDSTSKIEITVGGLPDNYVALIYYPDTKDTVIHISGDTVKAIRYTMIEFAKSFSQIRQPDYTTWSAKPHYYLMESTYLVETNEVQPYLDDASLTIKDDDPFAKWLADMKNEKRIYLSRQLEIQFDKKKKRQWEEVFPGTDCKILGDCAVTIKQFADLEINSD